MASKSAVARTSGQALPNKWKPFIPGLGSGRPIATEKVTLYRNGSFRLSGDLVERMGTPLKIQFFTDGRPNKVAVGAAMVPAGALTLRQTDGRQYEVKAQRFLRALGKSFGRLMWPTPLDFAWEDDLLVLDLSDVPDVESEDGP